MMHLFDTFAELTLVFLTLPMHTVYSLTSSVLIKNNPSKRSACNNSYHISRATYNHENNKIFHLQERREIAIFNDDVTYDF